MPLFRRSSSESGRDLIYVSLASAIEEGGCPICRLLSRVEVDALRNLLYEHVNDPHVRKLIVEGWGLCQYHSWLMARLAIEDPSLGGGLGPAIILEDLMDRFLRAIENESIPDVGSGCYVCKQLRDFEKTYVESFVARIENTDLLDRYKATPSSILCSKHFRLVLSLAKGDAKRRLLAIHLFKLERLEKLVRKYIDKHDYRCKEPITKEEAESWLLAIEALVGSKSLLVGVHRRI